jgi:hypothetical protein
MILFLMAVEGRNTAANGLAEEMKSAEMYVAIQDS